MKNKYEALDLRFEKFSRKSIKERKSRARQREMMDCDFPTTKEENRTVWNSVENRTEWNKKRDEWIVSNIEKICPYCEEKFLIIHM